MPNSKLINFINQQRSAGVDDATIKLGLQRAGWDEISISQAVGGTVTAAPAPAYYQAGGLSFWQKIIMSVTDPIGLLKRSHSESVNSLVTFVVILFGANLILNLISRLVADYKMTGLVRINAPVGLGVAYLGSNTLWSIILTLVIGPFAFLVITWLVYWFCRLFKGVGSYLNTVRALVYGSGALLLLVIVSNLLTIISLSFQIVIDNQLQLGSGLGFISVIIRIVFWVIIFMAFFTLYYNACGLVEVHGISQDKALIALLITGIIIIVICIIFDYFNFVYEAKQLHWL